MTLARNAVIRIPRKMGPTLDHCRASGKHKNPIIGVKYRGPVDHPPSQPKNPLFIIRKVVATPTMQIKPSLLSNPFRQVSTADQNDKNKIGETVKRPRYRPNRIF